LPGHELLVQFPSRLDEAGDVEPVLQPGDGLIVVDTPSAARMEAFHSIHESVLRDCRVIVFDHHFTNEQFGNVNYVDPSAAATAEVIGDVLDGSRLPLDLDSATCFMAALLADTQCFRTENTSGRSLYWGQRLVAAGAPIYALARLLLIARPYSALKLWGAALSRLQSDGPVYWTVVDQVMLREAQATIEDLEGLVDFILSSPEAMIAIVLKEDVPGETKVSMRTVPGVDATRIVGRFNGGGHQRAAGCTIAAGPDDAARLLLPLAAAELLAGAPAA
jgi:phosphoesterase RecJ-like protein